ncbi:MAG: ATP-dependent zinc metalloprotease FtsH [Deltaproteobacteria bacterium]|nr:MAG: ATP-dependent zinc metalloprotease FtsH [Deltaproteobacteria bacterium]TMQ12645.1 MAG: ATP-dependent zinc metalloprotease FtsH [Deltaproteobacteria bacterium]
MAPPLPSPTAKPTPPRPSWRWFIVLAIVTLVWLVQSGVGSDAHQVVDYTTMLGWVRAGKVKEVVLRPDSITGTLSEPQKLDGHTVTDFRSPLPKDDRLVPLLDDKSVKIKVENEDSPLLVRILMMALPWVLIIGVWLWLSRRTQQMMVAGGPLGGFLKRGRKFEKATAPSATFDDVAGLTAAKRDLSEIVEFLKHPELFRSLGARVPRGVLLVGPPGTGKTLLARAVAGEADAPFYSISASEFVEMFVGVGAARVRELFTEAKRNAPSIVFIDELDGVGRARGTGLGGGHDEREQTLNQLLSEMDGFERGDLVVVIAATNRPDVLDAALLRPGRFDRRVMIDLPEAAAREAILRVHTRDKPLAAEADLAHIAALTAGFSGADLANLANEAALAATRRRAEVVARADFLAAYDKLVLGDPREGKLRPVEKKRVAIHESGHAVIAWATPEAEPLSRVSILPRGMALGATQQVPPEDRHLHTRAELDARLRVLLGGYAAERVVLGEISTGAENDLGEATRLASKMVAHYGMSEALGPVHYDIREDHAFLGQRIATESGTSDATVHAIETEARALLAGVLAAATAKITAHRAELDRLSAALLEEETLERDRLEELLGPRATPHDVLPIQAPVPSPRTAHS